MSLRKTVLSIFLSVFFVLFVGATASFAGFLDEIKELKPVEFLPEAQFLAQSQKVTEVPYEDKFLAYEVYLPKTWSPREGVEKGQLSSSVLGMVSKYAGPVKYQSVGSYFTVEIQHLDYEIGAKNWFLDFILKAGYTLEGLTEYSDQKVEAIYVEVIRDDTYVVRLVAQINGPRIAVARYYVPIQFYGEQKVLQAQAVASFKLINPETRYIEERKSFNLFELSYFDYPESWRLVKPKVLDIDRSVFRLLNEDPSLDFKGDIGVHLISKLSGTTMGEEIQKFTQTINYPGYTLGELMEEIDFTKDPSVSFGMMQVYRLKPDQVTRLSYEIWVSVMESDGFFYIVEMLAPNRDKEFYKWSRSRRAFVIVSESVRQFPRPADLQQ